MKHLNRILLYSLIATLALSLPACYDDLDIEEVQTIRPDPQELRKANIRGQVILYNTAIPYGTVTILNGDTPYTTVADEFGHFIFLDVKVPRSVYILSNRFKAG